MATQKAQKTQKSFFDIYDVKAIIINLQRLVVCLKEAVYRLPDSMVRKYLLFKITKLVEIKNIDDFYRVQKRISEIEDIVIQENLRECDEVLQLLAEIGEEHKKIAEYTKSTEIF